MLQPNPSPIALPLPKEIPPCSGTTADNRLTCRYLGRGNLSTTPPETIPLGQVAASPHLPVDFSHRSSYPTPCPT